ncbi:hypothetical protein CIG75_16440 [Tumebacillus algifaecis]|uniref:Uncharacterized protein n=1 Tax=Tumebacillus algifaecis TaxID=1214604 RepID=A0A223D4C2_9BACL|nr:hypothetical protein [Tumebacillus algifaecis]ASS76385.1 hypothetical protein CIG75_16440 [Tumebacillus algifaecis]
MARKYLGRKRRREERRLLPHVPSDFIVPPRNPPGFGIVRKEHFEETPLITGQIYFDDPFYNVISPPPFGPADPAYPQWLNVMQKAKERDEKCPIRGETPPCQAAREAYLEAARQYAYVLDRVYGLNRVQPDQTGQPANKRRDRT